MAISSWKIANEKIGRKPKYDEVQKRSSPKKGPSGIQGRNIKMIYSRNNSDKCSSVDQ